ncbi:MAG: GrpB family protein [Candidatus Eisenbacteria bacterium]|nr:GrpB family protein [Candidatus Eisenbacteria bacterium]
MSDLDEPVELEEHQPGWRDEFERRRAELAATLGVSPENVEHIGSTAVPGLPAKPILDLMLGVDDLAARPGDHDALTRLGYEAMGEAGVPGRLYFRCRGKHPTNLHLVQKNGIHWVNNLALRDYLRESADARDRYARAKRHALAGGARTLLAYSAAKAATTEELLREALDELWKRQSSSR